MLEGSIQAAMEVLVGTSLLKGEEQSTELFPEKMLPLLAKIFIPKASYADAGSISPP